jgi:hypothetical protein
MMHEVLSPCVKHGKKADLCTKVLGVSSDRAERLGGGPEENVVNDSLVLQGNGGDAVGYRKNNMVVPDGQEFCLSFLQPFSFGKRLAFGAVTVAAGIVRYPAMAAPVTLIYVSAQCCSPAELDGTHDAPLLWRH